MQLSRALIRQNAKIFAAILIVTTSFLALRFSLSTSHRELTAAASRFGFSRSSLPDVAGPPVRSQRLVHPGLERISAFVSTVGAAVGLNDMDGDGLSNDVCYIDTRTDQVIITPAPRTSTRYSPFALAQEPPFFDRDRMAPLGVLLSDINEDGHVDVVVYYAGRTPLIFFWSPSGQNSESTLSAANYLVRDIFPKNNIWMTGSATAADFDGDGHLDLIFANYFKDGSDIYNPQSEGAVSMPHSLSHAANGGGERIYRWTSSSAGEHPTVTYEEVHDALPAGVGGGWGLAVGACDLDGDLLPELYVAHDFGPDRLFWNRSTPGRIRFSLLEGEGQFNTPKSYVLGQDSFKGMGVDFGDLNGDGRPDIYVSNITEPGGLQESQMVFVSTGDVGRMREGVAPYVSRNDAFGLSRSGWAWDAKLADFDNDGVLEALQATGFIRGTSNHWPQIQELATANDELVSNVKTSWPRVGPGADISGHDQNPFFVRMGDHYVDISRQIGFGEEYVSRGIAIGDVDYDGSLDMLVSNMWGPATYYHNERPKPGAFLGLHLLLPLTAGTPGESVVRPGHPTPETSGRAAISAVVTITLPGGQVLTRQIDNGNGHSGKRSPDLHFGLGQIEGPVSVRIDWRDPEGHVRQDSLNLRPGWYTVLAGWPKAGGL
ncbi:MAG: CRTAC1 family protein [Pyrinomonadaceae bacterium]|nr:CRTAC1 family protein [Pyrinomonadaceae bacterium]